MTRRTLFWIVFYAALIGSNVVLVIFLNAVFLVLIVPGAVGLWATTRGDGREKGTEEGGCAGR